MRKEDRNNLKINGIPYCYDEVLIGNKEDVNNTYPGKVLVMYEVFDGEKLKWGVKEEYINAHDRVCKSTPLFENVGNIYDDDSTRIIYLGDSKFILRGKINNSEVLCRINENSYKDNDFYQLETFSGCDVKLSFLSDNKVLAKFKLDGINKCMYFDYKNFKFCSNLLDCMDDNNYFIKTYVVRNEVRTFLGQLNDDYTVKPYGFDTDKREFMLFPLTEDGLIDEEEMEKYVDMDVLVHGKNVDDYKPFIEVRDGLMKMGAIGYLTKPALDLLNKEKTK